MVIRINYSSTPLKRRLTASKQVEEPATLEYPVGHVAHEVIPGYMANVFAAQFTQSVLAPDPVLVFDLPALHAVNDPDTAPPPAATDAVP